MAKDPAFLFYASDFLTGTMFFSNEQVGKYIRLLCSQHQHGGLIEKNSFNALVGDDKILRAKFEETEDGFYNIRLSLEMESRTKKSSNISEAAKETWKKRKENTIVLQSYKDSNTIVIRPEDENEDEIENIIEKRKKAFNEQLKLITNGTPQDIINSFFDYWTEHNEGGKKMRFEMEKVFDIKKRLATWLNRNDKFKNGTKTTIPEQKRLKPGF